MSGFNNLKVDRMSQNSLRLVEDKSVDKSKALEAALSQIERSFGKGSIMKLGSNENVVEIETVSTGSRPAERPHHRNLWSGKLR